MVPGEEVCAGILRHWRWPDGEVRCVKCGSRRVVRDGARDYCRKYSCSSCNAYFNDRTGTIFQDTKLPLSKWFVVALLIESEASVAEISRRVDVSYRNAYYVAKKLRETPDLRIGEILRGTATSASPR